MKIIELLNKIANGEEVPKKIKYGYKKFEFIGGAYEDENGNDLCYYDDSCMAFFNDEVEIIEEHKIPEKFKVHSWGDKDKYGNYVDSPFPTDKELMDKINEILDYLEVNNEF